MIKKPTALWGNLGRVYKSYGGFNALIRSEYFLASLLLSGLSWRYVVDDGWVELAKVLIPPLAGFSIAAYALFFAVLGERDRDALRAPAAELGGRSPLLMLASSISHAIIVQIASLLLAVVYGSKPFSTPTSLELPSVYLDYAVSAGGVFLTIYGITLIVASVLSIFRLLSIRSAAPPKAAKRKLRTAALAQGVRRSKTRP